MKTSRRKFITTASQLGAVGGLMSAGMLSFTDAVSTHNLSKRKSIGPNDTIRVGIIGTGGRGSSLIRNTQAIDGMEIVACCDILPFRLEAAMKLAAKGAKQYKDYRKLLEQPDLDAVIIATPLYLHFEMIKAAIEADKHIYCEKTMTFTIDEAKKLKPMLEKSDNVFQVGYQHRYNPVYQKAREIIQGDEFGPLSHVECYWNRNGDWRRPVPDPKFEKIINWRMYRDYSGGLMAELSSHQINIVNWMMGSAPHKVTGFGGINYWKDGRETYDNIHAIFEYPDGLKMNCSCLTTNAQMGFQMKFYGKNATVKITRETGYEAWLYVEPTYLKSYSSEKNKAAGVDAVTGATTEILKKGEPVSLFKSDPGREDAEPTRLAIASFGDCIRENKEPVVGYESAKDSAVCVALANMAMQTGEMVQWKDHV